MTERESLVKALDDANKVLNAANKAWDAAKKAWDASCKVKVDADKARYAVGKALENYDAEHPGETGKGGRCTIRYATLRRNRNEPARA